MFQCKLLRRTSGPVQRLNCLGLDIIEKTEGVPIPDSGDDLSQTRNAYPPIPQQLGSVTFKAAEVATAASAMMCYD
jgi:hypothetical protein